VVSGGVRVKRGSATVAPERQALLLLPRPLRLLARASPTLLSPLTAPTLLPPPLLQASITNRAPHLLELDHMGVPQRPVVEDLCLHVAVHPGWSRWPRGSEARLEGESVSGNAVAMPTTAPVSHTTDCSSRITNQPNPRRSPPRKQPPGPGPHLSPRSMNLIATSSLVSVLRASCTNPKLPLLRSAIFT